MVEGPQKSHFSTRTMRYTGLVPRALQGAGYSDRRYGIRDGALIIPTSSVHIGRRSYGAVTMDPSYPSYPSLTLEVTLLPLRGLEGGHP